MRALGWIAILVLTVAGPRGWAATGQADPEVVQALEQLAAKLEQIPRTSNVAVKEVLEPPYNGRNPLEQQVRAMVRVTEQRRDRSGPTVLYSPGFMRMAARTGLMLRLGWTEMVPEIIVARPGRFAPVFSPQQVQRGMRALGVRQHQTITTFLTRYKRQLNEAYAGSGGVRRRER